MTYTQIIILEWFIAAAIFAAGVGTGWILRGRKIRRLERPTSV